MKDFKNTERVQAGSDWMHENVYTVGINIDGWAHKVQIYGNTLQEATTLRDSLLSSLRNEIKPEVKAAFAQSLLAMEAAISLTTNTDRTVELLRQAIKQISEIVR